MTLKWRYLGKVNWTHLFINISSNERSKALLLLNKDKSVIIPLDGILNFLNAVKGYEETQRERERKRVHRYGVRSAASQDKFCLLCRSKLPDSAGHQHDTPLHIATHNIRLIPNLQDGGLLGKKKGKKT